MTPTPTQRFDLDEVARILRVPAERVRTLVRAGACRPVRRGRSLEFAFQDLVLLRAAVELLDSKVSPKKLRRALEALHARTPEGRPVSGLRLEADGRDVVVRQGGTAWRPDTGQLLLDFEPDRASAPAPGARATAKAPASHRSAIEWFEQGVSLELEDPEAARRAYLEAVEADPEMAEAWVNLGRLAHEAKDLSEAARLYERAVELERADSIAHYNLAVACEDLGRTKDAVDHYERAVELDPAFADAHWNLGRLLAKIGRRAAALRHLAAYKRLTEPRQT